MSDNIPVEIQSEVMKRLPVKSLIQFRSVCKAWKSLIDNSDFIKQYSGKMQHLVFKYIDKVDSKEKYVLIADDHTFPNQKVVFSTIHPLVKMFKKCIISGCSNGLLCLYGDSPISGTARAVIWNPAIRKAVDVVVPNVGDFKTYESVVGFGVCRETRDPKILKMTQIISWRDGITCIPWQVEVFALSAGVWRSPYTTNLPRTSIQFHGYDHVVISGVLYWLAMNRFTIDGEYQTNNLIISFDMTSEEFREINLPDCLAQRFLYGLSMYKLRESLVVFENNGEDSDSFVVWMMEDGVPETFTKLYTIDTPDLVVYVRGFRKTGELIIYTSRWYLDWTGSLAVYEPYSKSISNIGIDGRDFSNYVYSYTESLLLL